jgi:hypothetical protein
MPMNSLALNMLEELVLTIVPTKVHYLCLSMFTNISCIISSTLEDKKLFDPKILEVSCVKLEPWLKDENNLQMKKTLV